MPRHSRRADAQHGNAYAQQIQQQAGDLLDGFLGKIAGGGAELLGGSRGHGGAVFRRELGDRPDVDEAGLHQRLEGRQRRVVDVGVEGGALEELRRTRSLRIDAGPEIRRHRALEGVHLLLVGELEVIDQLPVLAVGRRVVRAGIVQRVDPGLDVRFGGLADLVDIWIVAAAGRRLGYVDAERHDSDVVLGA